MAISQSQLQTWSHQGATVSAKKTHESIRHALQSYQWTLDIYYTTYLQGSYRNSTNIYGDSDVDLVVELTSSVYSNLTTEEKSKLGMFPVGYTWFDFQKDVISALSRYYGSQYIDTSGSKSIKLLPHSGRIKADIVVSATYEHYEKMQLVAEGMTFWTRPGEQQICNFPKRHYDNGANKNSKEQTGGWYKPTVRVFKNARNCINAGLHVPKQFPSYFIECLLYNVPNHKFSGSFQSTFENSLNWLSTKLKKGDCQDFVCQNEMSYLFGNSPVQWNPDDARDYVQRLINL
ncbi:MULTISPECIES: nucleotidyltransferase [unclassified Roseofilum]|uniref:nucleotidyltransferase domain-containing protein n=1 Tax=unclassified Roseofilum TaxID=2620099 RepID=UPI001B2183DF|nr:MULTISPECIES: nucleotidyltransferase [unclassified Roseofilum]MBP0006906.1 nucleotidyltransferase [Roseofilum sp. Belize Diploria]MBP0031999.1 nucleotidyltransferase [Roseofilum sp. Belize BBD 4]MBP0043355.1 nucleotidyltransferase [Roseofilum sp. SBFL]